MGKLAPLQGYLLVKPIKPESSYIVLPQYESNQQAIGEVLAIGPDSDVTEFGAEFTCQAKKGDTVIFKSWGHEKIDYENEEYRFVRFRDLVGTIKGDNAKT